MATLTDLGVMQQTASIGGGGWARIGSGDRYNWYWYYFASQTTIKTNLFSLNLDDDLIYGGVEGSLGRPYMSFRHYNGLLYLGTSVNNDNPGKLGSYDFTNGTYTFIMDVPSYGATKDGILCGQWSQETNKRIFCGTDISGALFAYDPVADDSEDFGVLDDPGGPYYRYITSLQVNATYAYCALKDVTNNKWYLVRVTLSDQSETTYWKNDGCTDIVVYSGTNDTDIYVKKVLGGTPYWYNVTDLGTPISEPSYWSPGTKSYDHPNHDNYDVDWQDIYPDGVGGKTITFKYKRPGDSNWRTKTADLVSLDNYAVQRAVIDLDGNVTCFAPNYGPITEYNVAGQTKAAVGPLAALSGYVSGLDPFRGREYLCGYPRGADYEYDPDTAWNLTAGNPDQISVADGGDTNARYTRACFQGSDRNMWFGFSTVRVIGTVESILSYYNPVTTGGAAISATLPNGTNLNTYVYESFIATKSKMRLVFSGYIDGTDSLLAVIPVQRKGVSKYLRPISGGSRQGRIVSVATDGATINRVVGITIASSNYQVYCVDIGTGQLVWGPLTKSGTSYLIGGTSPPFGLGYVWFYVGTDIVKLNPANGDVTVVQAVTAVGGLVFNPSDNCLYHHDSTTKKLWKVSGLS